jgi:hypothetical protein
MGSSAAIGALRLRAGASRPAELASMPKFILPTPHSRGLSATLNGCFRRFVFAYLNV